MASLVVNTFPQAFLEILHHSLQHVGRNCCHFFTEVLFQIHCCPWFLFVHLALEISSEEEVLRLGTLSFRWILKCRRNILWVKTESLFLKYVSTVKARCSTDQRSMATEMLLNLARRALKDKFPTPTAPLTTVLQNRQVFLPDPVLPVMVMFIFLGIRWHNWHTSLSQMAAFFWSTVKLH